MRKIRPRLVQLASGRQRKVRTYRDLGGIRELADNPESALLIAHSMATRARTLRKTVNPAQGLLLPQEDFPVESVHDDGRELRRANDSILLRVVQGHLSLLSRKIFNVMIYHAQQQGMTGAAGPVSHKLKQHYYWIPLKGVARDIHWRSGDLESIKAAAQQLQDVKVVQEGNGEWTSERLVASLKLYNEGGRKHGGLVWLGFAFPPEVNEMVVKPENNYTLLTLYHQTMLSSAAALALFELCKRHLTNPSRSTGWKELEWWVNYLSGKPIDGKLPEYKYFKRDVLVPTRDAVNSLGIFKIDFEEDKAGTRKVQFIRFKILGEPQKRELLMLDPMIKGQLVARMMALGMTMEGASDFLVQHEAEKVEQALTYTEARMQDTSKGSLEQPAAYFKEALKGGWKVVESSKKRNRKPIKADEVNELVTPESQGQLGDDVAERLVKARREQAEKMFLSLSETDRGRESQEFLETANSTVRRSVSRSVKGVLSPLARSSFLDWYAAKVFKSLENKNT